MKDSNAVFARVVGEDSSFQNRNYLVSGTIPFDRSPRIVSRLFHQFGPFKCFVLAIAIILGQTIGPALGEATPGFPAFREPLADVRDQSRIQHIVVLVGYAREAAGNGSLTLAHALLPRVHAALGLRDPCAL